MQFELKLKIFMIIISIISIRIGQLAGGTIEVAVLSTLLLLNLFCYNNLDMK